MGFFSNFNYCPLVWMLANVKCVHKIEAIQKSLDLKDFQKRS